MKYKRKPVEIEAIIWTGSNYNEVKEFAGDAAVLEHTSEGDVLVMQTLESNVEARTRHAASVGDYVIKGVMGEFYFCKPDIFHMTYEAI